jgi:recombination protein RecA
MAVDLNFIQKNGAWYSVGPERIGQGRDNARSYLEEHPDTMAKLEAQILSHYEIGKSNEAAAHSAAMAGGTAAVAAAVSPTSSTDDDDDDSEESEGAGAKGRSAKVNGRGAAPPVAPKRAARAN